MLLVAGKGINKDVGKAIDWYQKAAIQGNIAAKFNLAEIYSTDKESKKMRLSLLSGMQRQLN